MSKALSEGPSIQATMEDQLRKTMDVVQSMRGNAEQLLSLTERIIVKLDEELPPQDPTPGPTEHPAPDPGPPIVPAAVPTAVPMAQETHDALVAAVTKATVTEVMATINPVLGSLQKFISDNAREPEPSEEAFAEKLVEELKHSLARRTRIALARKRLTAP